MRLIVLCIVVALAGCGGGKLPEGKRYPIQGEIKTIDESSKTATIDAGKIEGWMDAMPMEYPIKPDAELKKLHVGDHIEGTVVVGDPAYYVTDIKVVPKQ